MNQPGQTHGSAVIAVALVMMLLIVVLAGGGLFFLFQTQRAQQFAALERALQAEQMAMERAEAAQRLAEARAQSRPPDADREMDSQTEQGDPSRADGESTATATAEPQEPLPTSRPAHTSGNTSAGSALESPLARLHWLVGHWQRLDGPAGSEEHWLAARGGMMLGVNRSVSTRGKTSYEYLRIEASDGGPLVYVASPMGRSATEFPLLELGERRVTFENPMHDFPRRIRYWLDEAGRLHARIEGELNDEAQAMEWTWDAVR